MERKEPEYKINQINHVSFSGGGVKGISYIGVIRTLQEYDTYSHIKSWTGVSIGSLFALIGCLNIPWKYLLDEAINLNYDGLVDINLNSFFISQGIIEGREIDNLIIKATKNKITPHTTFKDLYKITDGKILYIVAYDIENEKTFIFSYDSTPNIKVLDAIKASCSLPIFLPPKQIENRIFYDGGLLETAVFNHLPCLGTVVWNLEDPFCSKKSIFNSLKILKVINSFRNIILKKRDTSKYIIYNLQRPSSSSEEDDQFLNFSITKDKIFDTFMKSYLNSKKYLYNDFIALPPPTTK